MGGYNLKNILLGIGIGLIIASMINISMGDKDMTVEQIRQEAAKHSLIVLTSEEIMSTRTPAENEAPAASPAATPAPTEAAKPAVTPGPTVKPAAPGEKVTVTVTSGMSSEDVSNLLLEAGLLKDKKAFMERLNELGMDSRLKVGTFEIVKGSQFDEIIRLLTK